MLATRLARKTATVAALLLAAAISACSSDPITQKALIGAACKVDTDCGSSWFTCATELPGGYCTKGCQSDPDCPPEAICSFVGGSGSCRKKCAATMADCRYHEGYACHPKETANASTFASQAFCEAVAGDGGVPPSDGGTGGDGGAGGGTGG